jgi:integrase
MTGRPRLALGEQGEIGYKTTRQQVVARVVIRDTDGRRRDVTATAATKGAAKRALERRLAQRRPAARVGVLPTMSVRELGQYWLDRRAGGPDGPKTGESATVRRGRAVLPQTLGAYATSLRVTIYPDLGEVQLRELTVGLLDSFLADLEDTGISTAQARSVLSQMLAFAVRQGALGSNPMLLVEPPNREANEVEALDLTSVATLRHAVLPETRRRPGLRGPNRDLCEVVDLGLGTGCRIGESLALQWKHLDLDGETPTALVNGTLVEPRKGFVDALHRQEHTKARDVRTLILPDHVVQMLLQRRARSKYAGPEDPVFASRNGVWIWPNNIRTRLRAAVEGIAELEGTTPHTLRRTVGTRVAHEVSLDAAREQLGHAHPGITGKRYVQRRKLALDLREVLDEFFACPDSGTDEPG